MKQIDILINRYALKFFFSFQAILKDLECEMEAIDKIKESVNSQLNRLEVGNFFLKCSLMHIFHQNLSPGRLKEWIWRIERGRKI